LIRSGTRTGLRWNYGRGANETMVGGEKVTRPKGLPKSRREKKAGLTVSPVEEGGKRNGGF